MTTAQVKELSTTGYWDTRYTEEQQKQRQKRQQGDGDGGGEGEGEEREYEWFRTFEQIRPFLVKHLPPAGAGVRVLQLGCGTSVSFCVFLRFRACVGGSSVVASSSRGELSVSPSC